MPEEIKSWPKAAIIVLNWNGWRDTIECLESIQRITYPNYQIIVVDNGSTDDSIEKIKAWARGEIPVESKFFEYDPTTKPLQWIEYNRATVEAREFAKKEAKLSELHSNRKLVLIQTEENLGYAGGNNVGIRYALMTEVDYIMLLNNDTVVASDFLDFLLQTMECNPRIGIAGPKIYHYHKPNIIQSVGGRIGLWTGRHRAIRYNQKDEGQNPDPEREVGYVSGACLMIRVETVRAIGLLDEEYFMYMEEVDWCFRAHQAGFKVVVVPESRIWHKEYAAGRTGEEGRKTTDALYYEIRNNILFMRKHAQPYHWLVYLPCLILRIFKYLLEALILRYNIEGAKALINGVLWHCR